MAGNLKDLKKLNRSDAGQATEVLIKAFWDHPPLRYFYPDEDERKRIAPYFFSISVLYGLKYGEVYAPSAVQEGIAIWLPSDYYPMSIIRLLGSVPLSGILNFGRYGAARMRSLGAYLDSVHARTAPFKHWYLLALGVAPQFQGKGYAGILLESKLSGIDKEGLPCYLETLEEKNVALYEHFGFKVADKSAVPGTSITNWAMLRDKRPAI